ncbi:MAG: type II secretion system protein GspD [Burkholderiales bacterium]|nr:type II secretion system protein GspD [Burkholderiales bacterium]
MPSFSRVSLLGLVLLLQGLALPALAAAPASKAITLNFSNAEIEAVARTLAVITGRNLVVDPRVKGTLSLSTDTPTTPTKAWDQFLAALRMQGYTMVETAGLYKIVPETEGKLQSESVRLDAGAQRGDQIVTEIFKLNYENANNLVPVLRPLISANNVINVNSGNNSLVITDYANNLVRLRTIIAAMDTPSATDVEVMPLQHALAADLAATVQRLTDSSGGKTGNTGASSGATTTPSPGAAAAPAAASTATASSGGASVLADTQSNSLLVRAPNLAQLAFIRSLVARLDRPRANSNVRVIYLKNADATRLAKVLRAAFPSSDSASGGSSGSSSSTPSVTQAASSSSSASSSSESSQASTPITATAQPSTGGGIQADPASNSLIITAPEPRFREMYPIIEQLDSRRAQLYVESLVVEVDATKTVDLGVQWASLFDVSSSTTLTLGTVAKALEEMTGTNILSTANIVTLDNEEAKIVVGQNVPFITGSYTTTSSSSSSPFQTIERKDVGITLRIRPQIGQNGSIRMTIYQESSSVASTSSTTGPTTNKRSIESTVMVNNGKTIVLGGLIEDSHTDDAAQVPGIADVPLLGALFRSMSRTRKKTNLLVFLRPVVMADENASNALSMDRYDYIRAKQKEMPMDIHQLPPDTSLPTLPPLSAAAVPAT